MSSPAPAPCVEAVPEAEFRCRDCGNWVLTAPAPWARCRCINRRCDLYRQQQLLFPSAPGDRPGAPQVHKPAR